MTQEIIHLSSNTNDNQKGISVKIQITQQTAQNPELKALN